VPKLDKVMVSFYFGISVPFRAIGLDRVIATTSFMVKEVVLIGQPVTPEEPIAGKH
jgi:hypothetical protein